MTVPSPGYVELAATSNFSFLRGASHPEELVVEAARLGLAGLSVADRNSLAGVVRAHMAAKEARLAFAPGCRLVFCDGTPDILVWPQDRAAYGRLCELLTLGKRRAPKGECHLGLADLVEHGDGLIMAVVPAATLPLAMPACLKTLGQRFSGAVYLAAAWRYGAADQRLLAAVAGLARQAGLPLLAVGDVLYHAPERRFLQDVVTCIREHLSLREAGRQLEPNAERHLRGAAEMLRLFKGYEQAVAETERLFSRLSFSLDELRYLYPEEPTGSATPPQETLERLTAEGLQERYPDGAPQKVLAALEHELALIRKLDYAPYFLTVYDIVRFARSEKILCQGRGSAANSAVCYCLGITEVDPEKVDLLFERFISEERNEPPDIDVDFEHERREEVIQYIYGKYGRDRAGLAATVITYRGRSALREVGKVFELSDDVITAVSGTRWGSSSSKLDAEDARRAGLDPDDKHLMQILDMASQIIGFPRHLSQHVGGFVITRDRLSSVIPIENAAMEDRTVVEWDKDDLESLGMLKIDVLGLGMLSCIRKAFEFLQTHYGRSETLSSLPDGDGNVYDMICRADTIGVFQIESRAQMSMLPRLKPRCYYDLVIEVAIVRPGPIQGDMVHPYLRRRQGKEPVSYPKQELKDVLAKTLGVPLFQEQAMNIAIVAANFEPGEADKLRRAMATFRRVGTIHNFRIKMVEGMVANGYERDFAEHCFSQIEGFGDYGFPESHAASFALLVYVSCWLKCYYPDVFCAAILNSQPMGFYAPAQLVRDAREHGVEVRPVDINHSEWLSTLEATDAGKQAIAARHAEMAPVMRNAHAVRLGFHRIKGIGEEDAELILAHRGEGYDSVRDLWMRSGLSRRAMEKLAEADAFSSIGLSRRDAIWAVRALDPLGAAERLPLFAAAGSRDLQREPDVVLPPMPLGEQVINDYRSLTFSLKAHPVSFVRHKLARDGYVPAARLPDLRAGRFVSVAGLVLVRQRPGSAKGVVFETLEDETGVANAIVWPKVFERYRTIVIGSRFIGVRGPLQSEDGVIHVVARELYDLTPLLAGLCDAEGPIDGLARADEVKREPTDPRERDRSRPAMRLRNLFEQVPQMRTGGHQHYSSTRKVLPGGRNFH
ncbi:error-prone DNA polymerase [Nitratireductor sp. XY-223]|uniref:error-prone DNA polymerase n=1 Tax=Nitratireductor sp. XY-223 TaxID=2561926 RepID=UPI0010AA44BB|nr:error-prone DNA polymerase [Nitratireductor sp. XY-223]